MSEATLIKYHQQDSSNLVEQELHQQIIQSGWGKAHVVSKPHLELQAMRKSGAGEVVFQHQLGVQCLTKIPKMMPTNICMDLSHYT